MDEVQAVKEAVGVMATGTAQAVLAVIVGAQFLAIMALCHFLYRAVVKLNMASEEYRKELDRRIVSERRDCDSKQKALGDKIDKLMSERLEELREGMEVQRANTLALNEFRVVLEQLVREEGQ